MKSGSNIKLYRCRLKQIVKLLKLLISLSLTTITMAANDEMWFTGRIEYEGFPLLLRFPEEKSDPEFQAARPKFVSVTHHLSEVTSDGLPEKDYNLSLEDFDLSIIEACKCIVLVETFAGKRNYYGYVQETFDLEEVMTQLQSSFPEAKLEWNSKPDPEWTFIKRYAAAFNLYETNN